MFNITRSIYYVIVTSFFISFSLTAFAKQQTALLDADGNPLSLELLTSLSTGKPLPKRESASRATKKINKSNVTNNSARKTHVNKRNSHLTLPPAQAAKPKLLKARPELERELLSALKEGKTARAMNLIKMGVKVNHQNYEGETPLSVAVTKGWASIARTLLEHGAKVNHKTAGDLSLLHLASAKGHTDMAKLLIKNGLNPSAVTKHKEWNSLHVAARYGHWQLVQLYLQMGVRPNARTSDKKTALEIAQIGKLQGIVTILSRVTSARPMGSAANYNKRENRKKYDELESIKRSKLAGKRAELRELASIKQAKIAHKKAVIKEKQAIEWRIKNGKCGPSNIYCIPKLTAD